MYSVQIPRNLPGTNGNGLDQVDGPSEPPTPVAEPPESIPVSPTSPTHPNFYLPPGDTQADGVRRTLSGTYTKDSPITNPTQAAEEPINLVLRLR